MHKDRLIPGVPVLPDEVEAIKRANESIKKYGTISHNLIAWDPDCTKLTPTERKEMEEAEKDMDMVSHEDINWD